MIQKRNYRVVLVTAPDLKVARRLARTVLAERLVACVNLVPRIESHYWWNGKLEKGSEVLMLLKTNTGRLAELEKVILEHHPYETPEFITLQLDGGNQNYLRWLERSLKNEP